jgi:hypothetical protein
VLGRVVGALRFNETCDALIGDEPTVYVVGPNGEIEEDDRPPFLDLFPRPQLRFVVREGCLATESDEDDEDHPVNIGGIEIIPPSNVCEDGSFPIGQLGLGDFLTEFICAELHLTPCIDCGMDEDEWFRRATATLRVEAEGSLDEVLLRNECGEVVDVGTIQEGNRATVTITIETRFRVVEAR